MRATALKMPVLRVRCFACSLHFNVSEPHDKDLVENNLCRRCMDEWTCLKKLRTKRTTAKPFWPGLMILAGCAVVGWMFWSRYLKEWLQ